MIFKGEGKVWDAVNNRVLCSFSDGVYETSDAREISILIKSYKFDPESLTKKELLRVLDGKGKAQMSKSELQELL